MLRKKIFSALLALAILTLVATTHGSSNIAYAGGSVSPCRPSYSAEVSAASRSTRYTERRNDDRCEGLYGQIMRASSSLVVVAFHEGQGLGELSSYPPNRIVTLEPLYDYQYESAFLTVVPLRKEIFYRLDARLPQHGNTFKWPLKDVVEAANIPLGQLGFYGTLGEQEQLNPVYIPLRLSLANRPIQRKPIHFLLRTFVELESVNWTMLSLGGKDCHQGNLEARGEHGDVKKDEIINIKMPDKHGQYKIVIRAREPDNKTPIEQCFVVQL